MFSMHTEKVTPLPLHWLWWLA